MKVMREKEAEDFLQKQGFSIINQSFIKKKEEIAGLDQLIDFPWAVKVSSKKIIHKAKVGGVILNIRNINEAEKAFDKLKNLPGFEGVLIQEMVGKSQLLILGLKKTDEFGSVVMIGDGGTGVEEKNDVSFRTIDIDEKEAGRMIDDLRMNVKHKKIVIENILKMCKVAKQHPKILELDINPLAISKKEATVIDARALLERPRRN